ncbi:ABC transporter substrate-binding protein [Aquibium carbonis]|uniref:ABC transporter substrate-binding protein n=1 Tax=Aquibium carbonis TaxID=2495581 RepID=A0A3R9ZYD0_9HYPH|nr:ABC transporter substrate-binding protein [Aquibium carbonis]RST80941.1 ABC transporter substrate-binding protein [Aquibium carbonis]
MIRSIEGTASRLAAVLSAALAVCLLAGAAWALEPVRVGVLKFGTVNWELDAMKNAGFDHAAGVDVEIVPFAGEDASNVALQAGTVDVIVSDWLWVSRLRADGADFTFVPYSSSVGAIMVPQGSALRTLADLRGRKLGVAGGPLDKSWLLIQGLARRDHGLDLAAENDVVYGAAPLLAEKARQGELEAVLNFWHHNARLEANGFRTLVGAEDAAAALGASGPVSALGYVFSEKWAQARPLAARGFVQASRATKALLSSSDAEWERLAPLVRADGAELLALRDRYRDGIPARPAAEDEADAARLHAVLAELGGEKLVGRSPVMAPGTYWPGLADGF